MSEFARLGKYEGGGNVMEGTKPDIWNSCKAQTNLTGLGATLCNTPTNYSTRGPWNDLNDDTSALQSFGHIVSLP